MLPELNLSPEFIRNAREIAYLSLLSISCVGTMAAGVAALWGFGKLVIPDGEEAHGQMWEDYQNDGR